MEQTEEFLPFTKPSIPEEAIETVAAVLRSGWLTNGPKVAEFETQLTAYFGGRPTLTFSSGTSCLEIALRIVSIGPGDEVITTPISWVATANAILAVGATPVFVDIEPTTRNLNLDLVERAITTRTRAIMPVHLAGRLVDLEQLHRLAQLHGLRVIEDAAQAIGASWQGRAAGSFGDIVAFSFQATKNITTGEGGCLVVNNEDEAQLARKMRLQGVTRTGYDGMEVDVLGGKHNMTEIAAAIGLSQLSKIGEITAKRTALAEAYFEAFGPKAEQLWQIGLPLRDTAASKSNWHLFQLVLPEGITRCTFQERMQKQFLIGTGCHYPAIHLFKLYRDRGFGPGMFPVAESVGSRIVTLPLFLSMSISDILRVVGAVKAVLGELGLETPRPRD